MSYTPDDVCKWQEIAEGQAKLYASMPGAHEPWEQLVHILKDYSENLSQPANALLECRFGAGGIGIVPGTAAGRPAVFLTEVLTPGEIGQPITKGECGKTRAVLTFPTEEQADRVFKALAQHVTVPDADTMVVRFLGWTLPKDFAPDAGISFNPVMNPHGDPYGWPTGTNLLNADQARSMFEYVLANPTPSLPKVHQAHCNLLHPVTLGTSEDYCDCTPYQPKSTQP